jgi:soluble lytic murein transglycosylase-like protein
MRALPGHLMTALNLRTTGRSGTSGHPTPRLLGATLMLGTALTLSVGNFQAPPVLERSDVAIPMNPAARTAWREEVHTFALQLTEAFKLDVVVADDFSGWILEASRRHDLSPHLLASVIFTESTFRTKVVSHAGAIGPAQVQPSWQTFCGASSLEDPAENIYCGAQILAYLRDVCGDERCALAAYNVGLRNHRESEEHQQAGRRYVRKVERHMAVFDTSRAL